MVLSEVIAMHLFFMFIFQSSEAANLVSRIVGETTSHAELMSNSLILSLINNNNNMIISPNVSLISAQFLTVALKRAIGMVPMG